MAASAAGALAALAGSALADSVTVTNLVSDGSVPAVTIDPQLINPWGIAFAPGNPFWVSDNNAGVVTLYSGAGSKIPLTVAVPPPAGGSGAGTPTGQVFNAGLKGFRVTNGTKTGSAIFIFDTEDGTIAGWAPNVDSTHSFLGVDHSADGAVYKGLAFTQKPNGSFLYAANFRAGDVEMYNARFQMVKTFTDPNVPAGYAPFNVAVFNGVLYVSFALQDSAKHDDVAGKGHGFVDVFSLTGVMKQRLVSGGFLNSPWGMTIAPTGFGRFTGDLLVGNFGNGVINAYDASTGDFKGALKDASGARVVIGDLWGLINGGAAGSDPTKVYFTAGVKKEAHGLFGSLTATP
jgi:uncharacterized protein (TIGR03118 family)